MMIVASSMEMHLLALVADKELPGREVAKLCQVKAGKYRETDCLRYALHHISTIKRCWLDQGARGQRPGWLY
jgi:hypothetical protein